MLETVSRTLSIHQEHEFLGALEKAGLNKDDAQRVIGSSKNELARQIIFFMRHGSNLNTIFTKDEKNAIAILGKSNVISANEITAAWDMEVLEDLSIPFPEKILRQCAEENKAGKADWHLIYVLGISLREQRELRGKNKGRQSHFNRSIWWLNEVEDFWTTKQEEAGYRLLNFQLQFTSMNWQDQTNAVAKLGDKYERASERDVAEAILSVFMVTGEKLLKHAYHWGYNLSFERIRVAIGNFDSSRLLIYSYWPDISFSYIGMVVSLKP